LKLVSLRVALSFKNFRDHELFQVGGLIFNAIYLKPDGGELRADFSKRCIRLQEAL
jgi:hypothetical protein